MWGCFSLSQFFPFFESHENTIVEFFFCYLSKWECKKYICGTLPFLAVEVNPTMTTSAAEKPGNVKNVHNSTFSAEMKLHNLKLPLWKRQRCRWLWKHPLMRRRGPKQKIYSNSERVVFGDTAAEYFTQTSIKWSYWHKTRASLWTGSQRETKWWKFKESASISQFVSVPLEEAWLWSTAFVNSQQSLFMDALQKACQMGYFGAEWH